MAGRRFRALCAIAAVLSVSFAAAAEPDLGGLTRYFTAKPAVRKPKVTVSKETTFVTGPLKPDGTVDFIAALNEMLSKGVTPENNAMVPMLQAFGRRTVGPIPRAYFEPLGMKPLPNRGDYLISFLKFSDNIPDIDNLEPSLYDHKERAARRPWVARDYPYIDRWLRANTMALAQLRAASRRPNFFAPTVLQGDGGLAYALSESFLLPFDDGCEVLLIRAMRSQGEGKLDEAWDDLMAIRRLCRLYGRWGFCMQVTTASRIEFTTMQPVASLLHCVKSPAQGRQFCEQLNAVREWPPFADLLDQGDRVFEIATALELPARPDDLDELRFAAHKEAIGPAQRLIVDPRVDWDAVLRRINAAADESVAIAKLPTWKQRRAAKQQQFNKAHQVLKGLGDFTTLEKRIAEAADGQRLLTDFIYYVCNSGDFGFLDFSYAEANVEVGEQLWQAIAALAKYRTEHGRYPPRLVDLTPKYLPKATSDPYTDAELVYRSEGAGYRLYSVGPNTRDDGGRNRLDLEERDKWDKEPDFSKRPDDIGVRVGVE